MGKCLKLGVLLASCVLAFGCAARQQQSGPQDETLRVERFRRSYEAAFDNKQQEASQQLISKARSALGTPYVRGGSSPDGFDCSGFVCWAYKSVGVSLPRTAREQSVVGKRITRVEDMRAGDIGAFRHPRRGYHTGIYVGDGKFIHSPHRRSTVRITSLDDPYFSNTFLGARRVKMEGGQDLVAQAERRLNDFTEERAVRDLSSAKKAKGKQKAGVKSRKKADKIVQVASNERSGKRREAVRVAKTSAKSARSAKSSPKASSSAKSEAVHAAKRGKAAQTPDKASVRSAKKDVSGKDRAAKGAPKASRADKKSADVRKVAAKGDVGKTSKTALKKRGGNS
jgi:hypothetical protein